MTRIKSHAGDNLLNFEIIITGCAYVGEFVIQRVCVLSSVLSIPYFTMVEPKALLGIPIPRPKTGLEKTENATR